MADEPLGMCPGEDDGTDLRIEVGSGDQPVQLLGDVEAEHLVPAAVDAGDQDGPAIFDLQMALVFVRHEFCSRAAFMGVENAGEEPRMRVAVLGPGSSRWLLSPQQAAGDWSSG